MKTIGLLGGMSFESTTIYYQSINERVQKALGGAHSAKIMLYSYDYDILKDALEKGDDDMLSSQLIEKAKLLEQAGADAIAMCANTVHIVSDQVQEAIKVPLIHIADATMQEAKKKGLKHLLLLGTNYTMESRLYHDVSRTYGIEILTPQKEDRDRIHHIIYNELIRGQFLKESKSTILSIIDKHQTIDGVILGCTELPLLIKPEDVKVGLMNTLEIHVQSIINFILS